MGKSTRRGDDFVAVRAIYGGVLQALVAEAGELCTRVDPNSLGWLEADGLIRRVTTAAPVPEGEDT